MKYSYNKQGSGRSVIFIHGFCENRTMWNDFAPLLATDHEIITIDLPGFGEARDQDVLHLRENADHVIGLMDELNIEKAVVAGHSMGGYVGLSMLQHHSDRLLGLSLFNSHAASDSEEKSQNRLKSIDFIRSHGTEYFFKLFVRDLLSAENDHRDEWINELLEMVSVTPQSSVIASMYRMMERVDQIDLVRSTDMPLQIMIGTRDKMYNADVVLEQFATGKNIDVRLFPSGHLGIKEMPDEYHRAFREFIEYAALYSERLSSASS